MKRISILVLFVLTAVNACAYPIETGSNLAVLISSASSCDKIIDVVNSVASSIVAFARNHPYIALGSYVSLISLICGARYYQTEKLL